MTPADDHVYFDLAGVASVKWDDTISSVVTQWGGWANPAEFSAMLEAELRALREHRGSRQLIDCRLQRGLRQADQEKADEEWLPRALTAGLKLLAIVRPTSGLAAMNLEARFGRVPAGLLDIKFFSSPEEARLWLAQ